jgi:hypothetical protein
MNEKIMLVSWWAIHSFSGNGAIRENWWLHNPHKSCLWPWGPMHTHSSTPIIGGGLKAPLPLPSDKYSTGNKVGQTRGTNAIHKHGIFTRASDASFCLLAHPPLVCHLRTALLCSRKSWPKSSNAYTGASLAQSDRTRKMLLIDWSAAWWMASIFCHPRNRPFETSICAFN